MTFLLPWKENFTGATLCPASREHCVLLSPSSVSPLFCCSESIAHLFPPPHGSQKWWIDLLIIISISGGYNKGFTLCFKKGLFSFFFIGSLLKCFYWKLFLSFHNSPLISLLQASTPQRSELKKIKVTFVSIWHFYYKC